MDDVKDHQEQKMYNYMYYIISMYRKNYFQYSDIYIYNCAQIHKWYFGSTVLSFLLGSPFSPHPLALAPPLLLQKLPRVKYLVYTLFCLFLSVHRHIHICGEGVYNTNLTHMENLITGFLHLAFYPLNKAYLYESNEMRYHLSYF